MSEPVAVRVRDCECPGTPHAEEGDVVYVAPTPSLACGLAAEADVRAALREALEAAGLKLPPASGELPGHSALLERRWMVTFVRHGACAWNFLDADGRPVPFDVETILADFGIAIVVAEKCDELYGDTVTRPLVSRLSGILQGGRKGPSTSRDQPSIRKPRRRSSRATSAASRR